MDDRDQEINVPSCPGPGFGSLHLNLQREPQPRQRKRRRSPATTDQNDDAAPVFTTSKRALEIGDSVAVSEFYSQRFKCIQQTICRAIAKDIIKAIARKSRPTARILGGTAPPHRGCRSPGVQRGMRRFDTLGRITNSQEVCLPTRLCAPIM
jgi:hypothetical protein